MDVKNGLYLVERHARLIISRRKTLIIKAKKFEGHINEPLYLLAKNKVYGIIVLKEPKKITLEEFKTLFKKHLITDTERKKWWNNTKEFFAYDFELKKIFRPPLNWKYKKGVQNFVLNVEIEKTVFLKMPIDEITPKKLQNVSDKELLGLHRRLHMLYARFFKLSVEDLVNAHYFVVQEMKRRGMHHHTVDELDRKTEELGKTEEGFEKKLNDPLGFFAYLKKNPFKGKLIVPDYVSLAGSYGRGQADKDSDLDIVIRRKERDVSTEIRIAKQLPVEIQDKLHFVYNECLVPGSFVFRGDDVEKIENIRDGQVLDAYGRLTNVLGFASRQYKGNIYTIKPRYLPSVTLTEEHPVLILEFPKNNYLRHYYLRKYQKGYTYNWLPKWKKAKELQEKDYVSYPVPQIDIINSVDVPAYIQNENVRGNARIRKHIGTIKLTPEFGELCGWYLAEGDLNGGWGIHFSLGLNETTVAQRLKSIGETVFGLKGIIRSNKSCMNLYFYNVELSRFFANEFNSGAKNKKIPSFIMHAPLNVVRSFIFAYTQGDGTIKPNRCQIVTTSEKIVLQLIELFARFGVLPSIAKQINSGILPQGTCYKKRLSYHITFQTKAIYSILGRDDTELPLISKKATSFIYDNKIWFPITKITKNSYDGLVYNINTESNTYLSSFVVHNSGPHGSYIPLYDLVILPKKKLTQVKEEEEPKKTEIEKAEKTEQTEQVEKKIISPGVRFAPMKPLMKGYTEFFSTEELWPWVEKKLKAGKKLVGEIKFDGFRCCGASTYLLSQSGLTMARFIKKGDKLLGHDGKEHKVVAIQRRKVKKGEKIFKFTTYGGTPVILTENHPVLTSQGWKFVQDLKEKDWVYTAIPKREEKQEPKELSFSFHGYKKLVPRNKDFWRFIGYWIGDGSTLASHDSWRIRLHFGNKTNLVNIYKQIIENIFQAKVDINQSRNYITLAFWDRPLLTWLSQNFRSQITGGAESKTLPNWISELTDENWNSFLQGWYDADGNKTGHSKIIVTVSPTLIEKAYLECISRGILAGITIGKTNFSYQGKIKKAFCYKLTLWSENKKSGFEGKRRFENDYIAAKIHKFEKLSYYPSFVYDFEVEGSHNFSTPSALLHNCILSNNGKVSIWFEDSQEERSQRLPELVKSLEKVKGVILDGELVFTINGKKIPRTQQLSVLAGKLRAEPKVYLFDILYEGGKDIHEKPLFERRQILEKVYKKLDSKYFELSPQKPITSKEVLQAVGKWAASQPNSEGLMVKTLDAPYIFGGSDEWAKWKTIIEIKCAVLKVIRNKAGNYNYEIGVRKGNDPFVNVTEDKKFVRLGRTFNTVLKASEGDTLNILLEELLILKEKDGPHLATGKPTVRGIDKSRPAYFANQAVDIARRAGVLKEEVGTEGGAEGGAENGTEKLEKMKAPFSIFGAKSRVAKKIISYIPEHNTYVEPFCGAATVFFGKKPSKKEVLSDLNPRVYEILHDIQNLTDKEIEELKGKNWVGSESLYKKLFKYKPKNRVERLYKNLYIAKFGWTGVAAGPNQFRHSHTGVKKRVVERLTELRERLKQAIILNKDYKEVVQRYDNPQSFFFLDPPYFTGRAGGEYGKYDVIDEKEFWQTVKKIKGKFLITLNSLNKALLPPKCYIKKFKIIYTQHQFQRETRFEYFISNYPLEPQKIYTLEKSQVSEEEETRGERATAFWKEHWHESYPKSGGGQYVYHHHWRGLFEEEAKMTEEQLLETDHSVHGDLRMKFKPGWLFGFTIFLGETKDLRNGRDVYTLKQNDKLQGTWKLLQPCLSPNTLIWTDSGLKKASSLLQDDFILNGDGKFDKPMRIDFLPNLDKRFIRIKSVFGDWQEVSLEHPYLVLKPNTKRGTNRISEWSGGELVWKKASELKVGDLLVFPKKILGNIRTKIHRPHNVGLNPNLSTSANLGRLFGFMLGDGRISRGNSLYLYFGHDKYMQNKYNSIASKLNFNIKKFNYNNQLITSLSTSRNINRFKKWISNLLLNKKDKDFPISWLSYPLGFKIALLEGLIDSDGWRDKKGIHFVNTSLPLASKTWLLALSLGKLATWRERKNYKFHSKEFGENIYEVNIYDNPRRKLNFRENNDYWFFPIRKIQTINSDLPLINITMPDGTFCLPNAITHNSVWLSVGKPKPYISKPLDVGATSKKYAKFFADDFGSYRIGVWREHFLEFFFSGNKLKGRYLIQYAPLGFAKSILKASSDINYRRFREAVLARDGYKCVKCGSTEFLTVHHLVPLRDDPTQLLRVEDGQTLCWKCHEALNKAEAGRRVWLISKPKDQKPYAESHKLEEVLSEIKRKGQQYLIWCDGKSKPVKYKAKTGEAVKEIAKAEKKLELIFLGTGPTKPVEGKGKDNRTNSSLFIKGPNVLIDCTPQIEEQLKREKIDPNEINSILITHAHRDACMGFPILDKLLTKKVTVYAPPKVLANKRLQKKFENLILKEIVPYQQNEIEELKVIPFRVIHAEAFPTGKSFPAYGYRFDSIVYAEDMEKLPTNSKKYFENAKIIVADAAMYKGQIRGHMNYKQTLELAKEFNPKTIILTQAGHEYPPYTQAQKEIEEYWKKIGGKGKVILAYDGLTVS